MISTRRSFAGSRRAAARPILNKTGIPAKGDHSFRRPVMDRHLGARGGPESQPRLS